MSDLQRLRKRVTLGDVDAAWELVTLAARRQDAESVELAARLLRARPLTPDQAVGTTALEDPESRAVPEVWSVSSLILLLNIWLLGWRRGDTREVPLDDIEHPPGDILDAALEAFREAGWEVEAPVHRSILFGAAQRGRRELSCPRCRLSLHLLVEEPERGFGFDMDVEDLRRSLGAERQTARVTCDRCRFEVIIDTGEQASGVRLIPEEHAGDAFLDAVHAAIRALARGRS